MVKFQNKIGLKGCKWSSLNAPGTESPVTHSFLGDSHIPYFPPQSSGSCQTANGGVDRGVMKVADVRKVPSLTHRMQRARFLGESICCTLKARVCTLAYLIHALKFTMRRGWFGRFGVVPCSVIQSLPTFTKSRRHTSSCTTDGRDGRTTFL